MQHLWEQQILAAVESWRMCCLRVQKRFEFERTLDNGEADEICRALLLEIFPADRQDAGQAVALVLQHLVAVHDVLAVHPHSRKHREYRRAWHMSARVDVDIGPGQGQQLSQTAAAQFSVVEQHVEDNDDCN